MTAVVPNPRDDVAPEVPLRPDGTPYRYEMICAEDTRRVYADTHEELVAALIEGYAELEDPTARLAARLRYAMTVRVHVQAHLCVAMSLARCSSAEIDILLSPDLSPDEKPSTTPGHWSCDVPLVLVDVLYAPYADVDGPGGNVIWLAAATDMGIINSLDAVGVIALFE